MQPNTLKLVGILERELHTGNLLVTIDEIFCIAELIRKLGFTNSGRNTAAIRSFLDENDIDTSHFTSKGIPTVVKIGIVCPVCKDTFEAYERDKQTTCSRSCSNTYFRSGENHGNWTGGESTYRKNALKTYGSKCSECGFSNVVALQVHHIDEDRSNNDISNLVVLCANCHLILHSNSK